MQTNNIWEHYENFENNLNGKAKCKYCGNDISSLRGSTSPLWRHLRNKHASLDIRQPDDGRREVSIFAKRPREDKQYEFQMLNDGHVIEAVRQRPELYDKSHPGYKVLSVKTQAWRSIAKQLQDINGDGTPPVPANAVAVRWNCLRERFTREVRKVEQNLDVPSAWSYFSSLLFLRPYLRKKKSFTSGIYKYSPPSSPIDGVHVQNQVDWVQPEQLPIQIKVPSKRERSCDVSEEIPSTKISSNNVVQSPLEFPIVIKMAQDSVPANSAPDPALLQPIPQKPPSIAVTSDQSPQVDLLQAINTDLAKMTQIDSDYLLGKSVESVLKALVDSRMKVIYRRKFRDLISECEEKIVEISDESNQRE